MPERMTEQQLADFLETTLPPVGEQIPYKEWAAQVRASEHPEALNYYRHLKKINKVKPTLTQSEDGSIVHIIERV